MADHGAYECHWYSTIVSPLMIVTVLSMMVGLIILRKLFRDISKYNHLENHEEESLKETGWKLVQGDVFRPPANPDLPCVFVGTGVQIFLTSLVTMIVAVLLGFRSLFNQRELMRAMFLLWNFMGLFAGYTSARLYKMLKGKEWKKITLKTAFMFPSTCFAIWLFLNVSTCGEKSSFAVPFRTMFALILTWFGISVPLVFLGGYAGSRKQPIQDPAETNNTPRQIPEQPWYMNPILSILIGGILPFGAIFVELFIVLTSIRQHQYYNIFIVLFILFGILIITFAETTIVICYFHHRNDDYFWWWRSYLTSGSSALYISLYAAFHFFSKLESSKTLCGIMYLGYLLLVFYALFILTGYWFLSLLLVHRAYPLVS